MKFLIFLVTIIVIALVLFVTWFLSMKTDGKCPICALQHLGGSKLTINPADDGIYDNGVDPAPIMGWSSWNTLRNHIDEETILETAAAIKQTGLQDAGYKYINLDDCWQSSMRDEDGMLQGDLETFPSGMDKLCKALNSQGFKMGIYSSNGTLTCEDLPASLGNEELDAKTFTSWGVEYLKYDFCHNKRISGSTPIIEYIDVSKRGKHASISLKPNSAKLTGRAKVVKCTDLPSKKGIGFLNHNAGTATFDFDVATGGEYVLTVHFHKASTFKEQYMQLDINGRIYEMFFPKGRSFTGDARAQIEVMLQDGNNTIKLFNPVVTRADSAYIQYKRMADSLLSASKGWSSYTGNAYKPITFSICEWGFSKPYAWGKSAGNMWRTTHDIFPYWSSIRYIYEKTIPLYKYARPGHVNDPDMLEVGNGKLTAEENKSHFTLWCMMAAPLVLGNDVRKLLDNSKHSNEIIDIVTNKSLILIDQDPLVKPAKRIKKSASVDILARPLYNGDIALCFFNKSGSNKAVDFDIDNLREHKYLNFQRSQTGYHIHDIWADDRFHKDNISTTIPKHGVKVYRISL